MHPIEDVSALILFNERQFNRLKMQLSHSKNGISFRNNSHTFVFNINNTILAVELVQYHTMFFVLTKESFDDK